MDPIGTVRVQEFVSEGIATVMVKVDDSERPWATFYVGGPDTLISRLSENVANGSLDSLDEPKRHVIYSPPEVSNA